MSTASNDYYQTAPPSPLLASPFKKKNMSITQTYYLAHKARAKLSSEASRPDHNLRLLVGHANLLDSLMLELHDAEREQESWFNNSVRSAAKEERQSPKPQHITWADQVIEEEPEEDWDDSSSDDSSDDEEYDSDGDVEMADTVSLYRVASHPSSYIFPHQQPQHEMVDNMEVEEDEFEDDEEDFAQLTLTRSPSHPHSPPALDDDEDSEDDESMPPSPPNPPLPEFDHKQAAATALFSPSDSSSETSLYEHGFFLPQRNPARLVSTISVY